MTSLEKTKVASILIIDNSPDENDLGLMQQILATQGYQIDLASSLGSVLIPRFGARPDLIIVNWKMTQMAEVDLRSSLGEYKRCLNIPILLLSDSPDICLKRALELGADGLLLKPFEVDRLLASIDSLLKEQSNLTDVAQELQKQLRMQRLQELQELSENEEGKLTIEHDWRHKGPGMI